MKYLKSVAVAGVLVLGMSFLPSLSHAQPGDPGGDPDTPVDGGIGLLVAAGVGYGVKKYRDSRKKISDPIK